MTRKSESVAIEIKQNDQLAPTAGCHLNISNSAYGDITEIQEKYSNSVLENEALGKIINEYKTSLEFAKNEKDKIIAEMAKISDMFLEKTMEADRLQARQQTERSLRAFLYKNIKIRNNIFKFKLLSMRSVRRLKKSGYFDVEWYTNTYLDVKKSRIDPVKHYYYYGAFEGRNPSANFNTLKYLSRHPDVAKSGTNPLLHYVKVGKIENRIIEPAENGS